MKDLLEIGRLTKPIGFKGRMKAVSYIGSPNALESLQDIYIQREDQVPRLYHVTSVRFSKKNFSLEINGIENTDAARSLVGCRVFIPVDRLEALREDEYYWRDIIGLEVRTSDGQKLGIIDHIIETGSNDVYVCRGGTREILLPAIDDVIKKIDFEKGVMIVDLLDGL